MRSTAKPRTLACMLLGVVIGQPLHAAAPVEVVAYLNQSSGCQTQTEDFLVTLRERFGKRISMTIVDFGGSGRTRWQDDNMHCMGIKIDGKLERRIWFRGVQLRVTFKMPEGHLWKHAELEAAVRQAIEGPSPEDRRPPEVRSELIEGIPALLIAGEQVLTGPAKEDLDRLAEVLRAESAARPLVQEDLAVEVRPDAVRLRIRERIGLEIKTGPENGTGGGPASAQAAARVSNIVDMYPRLSRPFPGMKTAIRGN